MVGVSGRRRSSERGAPRIPTDAACGHYAEPDGPITITVAEPGGDLLHAIIRSPTRVQLDRTDGGANAAVEIDSADGTTSILRFRTTGDARTVEERAQIMRVLKGPTAGQEIAGAQSSVSERARRWESEVAARLEFKGF